jgi:ABC-type nickel/cobalt efflux system permease component RcnA
LCFGCGRGCSSVQSFLSKKNATKDKNMKRKPNLLTPEIAHKHTHTNTHTHTHTHTQKKHEQHLNSEAVAVAVIPLILLLDLFVSTESTFPFVPQTVILRRTHDD